MFEAIVYRRQEHHRRQHQLGPLPALAVCADGTRQRLDQDLLSCLKYFVNFFFYKFGLEVRSSVNLHPVPGQDGGAVSPLCGLCWTSAMSGPLRATGGG